MCVCVCVYVCCVCVYVCVCARNETSGFQIVLTSSKLYRKGTRIRQATSFSAPQSITEKTHGSLLTLWMNDNYTCMLLVSYIQQCFSTSIRQFWQIGFESYWLHCFKVPNTGAFTVLLSPPKLRYENEIRSKFLRWLRTNVSLSRNSIFFWRTDVQIQTFQSCLKNWNINFTNQWEVSWPTSLLKDSCSLKY